MIIVLACYGTRGDVEPGVALGRELLRRGHEVRMAVPPDLVCFAEASGLEAAGYGLDTKAWMDVHRDLWTRFSRSFWKMRDVIGLARELWELLNECWGKASTALSTLTDGADLLITGRSLEETAANVAEYRDIPLITLHYAPSRPHGQLTAILPSVSVRAVMTFNFWLYWRMTRKVEDTQRRELGLLRATSSPARRIAERGSLEIQAYDLSCFPGLAREWKKWTGQRPFVGALTLELPTEFDSEIASWIAAGTPPIYFGFGSIPIEHAAETVAMIGAACSELGERALICSAGTDVGDIPHDEHVKIVRAMNHGQLFPTCRAVVHHGGAGTTAAGMRAGVPTLILWTAADQPLWGAQVKRLKVGTARRFSSTTQQSLVKDLRTILAPQSVARARQFAAQMTTATESVTASADLVENSARLRPVG